MKKLLLCFGFLSIFVFNLGVLTQNAEAQIANHCLVPVPGINNATFVDNLCDLPVGYAVCLRKSSFIYAGCENGNINFNSVPARSRNIMVIGGLNHPYYYNFFSCLNRLPVNVIWNGYGLVGQC